MFAKLRSNFALLRRAGNVIGPEFEALPYERLLRPAEELSGEREFEGVRVQYSAEAYRVDRNGDIAFCIDIHAKLPTLLGIKPSYQFKKRRDGTVYY